jgi:hypothetical protein
LRPKAKSAQKSVGVVAQAAALRKFLQFFGIAAPKHYIVRF